MNELDIIQLLKNSGFLEEDQEKLKEKLTKFIKDHERDTKRIDRIIKQSDKQQMEVLKLNEEIEKLREYDIYQQNLAKKKVEACIVAEAGEGLEIDTFFIPSDILSGDYYSIYKKDNGSTLLYILDGQGHGIPPSLTVFAVSSVINRFVKNSKSLEELLETISPYIKQFLAMDEQLSYTFLEISPDKKVLAYASGGMYPILIKNGNNIVELRSTGLPIMSFLDQVHVKNIEVEVFDEILIYSDGIVEGANLKRFEPDAIIMDAALFQKAKEELHRLERDDDITVIRITSS